ncbi:Na+/H+ antiporter subunit E [Devosia albogilva]|uniref:Na+/H+ antiporter subunit E n=1 Tax=Devosia albogilva TaxID=429726 RepID=A0ABW5QG01_9HYPH
MRQRLLPHPVLSAMLLGLWLLFQQSAGLGHLLLGALLALVIPVAVAPLLPEQVIFRRPLAVLKILAHASIDIVRSNLAVFWVLIHPDAKPTAGFVEVDLELTHPFGLSVLACLVTAIPGSAWLEYDRTRSMVLIHVFDLVDEEEWVRTLKTRYEQPLMELLQ